MSTYIVEYLRAEDDWESLEKNADTLSEARVLAKALSSKGAKRALIYRPKVVVKGGKRYKWADNPIEAWEFGQRVS